MSKFRDTPAQIVHDYFPSPVKHGREAAIKAIRDLVKSRDARIKELTEALSRCRETAAICRVGINALEELSTKALIGGDPGN